MTSTIKLSSIAMCIAVAIVGCTQKETPKMSESKPASESPLSAKIRRFAPTDVTTDLAQLSDNDRKALDKIIAAAKLLDPLFMRQVWSGNEALQKKLEADTSPEGRERLHYFMINKGPWSRLD